MRIGESRLTEDDDDERTLVNLSPGKVKDSWDGVFDLIRLRGSIAAALDAGESIVQAAAGHVKQKT